MPTYAPVDWEKAWEYFNERYKKLYPDARKAREDIAEMIKDMWKYVSPMAGYPGEVALRIDGKGELEASMAAWLLLGAAANYIIEKLSRRIEQLEERVSKLEGA